MCSSDLSVSTNAERVVFIIHSRKTRYDYPKHHVHLYLLKLIPMTGLNANEDAQDEPVVIPQQNDGARDKVVPGPIAGPKVLAHTNLAKTGSK